MVWTWVATVVVIALSAVHTVLSFYVFGVVPLQRTKRVVHVYLGYALFLLVVASQTNLHHEPLHTVLTALMYVVIAVHVGFAFSASRDRRAARTRRVLVGAPVGP